MDIDVLRALSNQIARVAMELKPLNDNLRRLNITNAENARLREVVADGELHAREILAENAKLREFATETWELLTCNEPVFVWKELQELARNLEIEVDE